MRSLDRQIYGIRREEQKVTREIKEAAKKGDRDVCIVLAKSLLQSRKAVGKINISKAQINSVIMCMQEQLATMRMAGSLQKSTEVMKSMQSLVKTMREMSAEMMKLGIIDEMIEETMESIESADLEEQAQEEVDRILWEVTAGELGKAPTAVTDKLG
uniref:Charged multivesicular body protein 3 n=1 Tax=Heterorhabditis bacteriophora TaxID=37862 RepID=A0A1I7X1K5_HETBA